MIEAPVIINPVFCNPMKAIKRPIPTVIPFFMLGLSACMSCVRKLVNEMRRNKTPEIKTMPSAVCHGASKPAAAAAGRMEKTKKKLTPIPGARAMG